MVSSVKAAEKRVLIIEEEMEKLRYDIRRRTKRNVFRDRCATLEEQEDKKADELIRYILPLQICFCVKTPWFFISISFGYTKTACREFSKQRDLYEQERSAKHAECEQLKRAVERETETVPLPVACLHLMVNPSDYFLKTRKY